MMLKQATDDKDDENVVYVKYRVDGKLQSTTLPSPNQDPDQGCSFRGRRYLHHLNGAIFAAYHILLCGRLVSAWPRGQSQKD